MKNRRLKKDHTQHLRHKLGVVVLCAGPRTRVSKTYLSILDKTVASLCVFPRQRLSANLESRD
eukprot:599307-Amphidinium_carterae.2